MPIIYINLASQPLYEVGAAVATALTFSEPIDDDNVRGNIHASLCALALRAKTEADEEWARTPQLIKPLYACRSANETERDLRKFRRRLRNRMAAARMAVGFLQRPLMAKPPPLPKGMTRLSLNQLAQLVLEDAGQQEPKNVVSRIWKPSLPVIHLAVAISVAANEAERHGLGTLHIFHLLGRRDVLECIAMYAKDLEEMVIANTNIHVSPDDLERIRLV